MTDKGHSIIVPVIGERLNIELMYISDAQKLFTEEWNNIMLLA